MGFAHHLKCPERLSVSCDKSYAPFPGPARTVLALQRFFAAQAMASSQGGTSQNGDMLLQTAGYMEMMLSQRSLEVQYNYILSSMQSTVKFVYMCVCVHACARAYMRGMCV